MYITKINVLVDITFGVIVFFMYVFADLFAGTGVVGKYFKSKGCKVISNDIQYYSYVLNKHYIENNSITDIDLLDYLDSLSLVDGFIYKNYCIGSGSKRNYFTNNNGKKFWTN